MADAKIQNRLEQERRKLIRLINRALEQGVPITDNAAILEQSHKVDTLIIEMQKGIGKTKRDQRER